MTIHVCHKNEKPVMLCLYVKSNMIVVRVTLSCLCVIDGEEGNDAFGRQFGVPAFELL